MLIQKTLFRTFIVVGLIVPTTVFCQTSFDNYRQKQEKTFQAYSQKFIHYNDSLAQDFTKYKKAQQKAYNEYKKELLKYWDNPELTTQKRLVHYTKDKQTKTAIDFKKKQIQIQTIAKNHKEAKRKLAHALLKAVTMDTKQLYKEDELLQKLDHIKTQSGMLKESIDAKPILSNVLFKKPPTIKDLIEYTKKEISKNPIKAQYNSRKKHIYTLNIKLPDDTTIKRSRIYYNEVYKAAKREKISPALIFAVMHTESCFNPYARSYIPAYGLMQIVPRTAGVDAYYYLYKEKRLLTGNYLYNSYNNIRLGSAYLHILYYKYLKGIKDPLSRLYCTIAAYNTGAGNVARAFGNNNVKYAAKKINVMSPNAVYHHLKINLHYKEARDYLQKVENRRKLYLEIYGS